MRIDPGTDMPIDNDATQPGMQAIELHHSNPVGHFAMRGGNVWIASVGSYQRIDDGAVEAIDTANHSVQDAVTEMELGGNVDAVIVLDDDRLLLRVTGAAVGSGLAIDSSHLVEWRISTRMQRPWFSVPNYALTEPVLGSDGRVYVGDRGDEVAHRTAAIHVFDAVTGSEIEAARVVTALPPYDLVMSP